MKVALILTLVMSTAHVLAETINFRDYNEARGTVTVVVRANSSSEGVRIWNSGNTTLQRRLELNSEVKEEEEDRLAQASLYLNVHPQE